MGSDKTAAKQCLLSADHFLKGSRFQDARTEIEKTKKFNPSNVYVLAFLDRINYFEAQKKKEAQSAAAKARPAQKSAKEARSALHCRWLLPRRTMIMHEAHPHAEGILRTHDDGPPSMRFRTADSTPL